jgi:hypothetical protein
MRDFCQEIKPSSVVLAYGVYAYENVLVCSNRSPLFSVRRSSNVSSILLNCVLCQGCTERICNFAHSFSWACACSLNLVLNVRPVCPTHFSGHSAQFSQ